MNCGSALHEKDGQRKRKKLKKNMNCGSARRKKKEGNVHKKIKKIKKINELWISF